MIMVVLMVVVMVMAIILLEAGDVFVNCDRRFGRWWTRRFLSVAGCVGIRSSDELSSKL